VSLAEAESPGRKLAEHVPNIDKSALKESVQIHDSYLMITTHSYLNVAFLELFSNTLTIATFKALDN
jgi:hypothetical protein